MNTGEQEKTLDNKKKKNEFGLLVWVDEYGMGRRHSATHISKPPSENQTLLRIEFVPPFVHTGCLEKANHLKEQQQKSNKIHAHSARFNTQKVQKCVYTHEAHIPAQITSARKKKTVYRHVRKAMRQCENEKLNSEKKIRHRCQNEYIHMAHRYEVNTNKTERPTTTKKKMISLGVSIISSLSCGVYITLEKTNPLRPTYFLGEIYWTHFHHRGRTWGRIVYLIL